MQSSKFFIIVICLLMFQTACRITKNQDKEIPAFLLVFSANSFASPIGETDFVTESRDRDAWYNAQDFGENRHLGEDWNANTGGDTDCGAPVYAAADGRITFAEDSGAGWGNVVIIEHTAADGTKIQSLYGHLESIVKTSGEVKRREQIGTVGNADGHYKCHLHFEIRWTDCLFWNKPGGGYGDDKNGWIDPSEFINKTRRSAFWQ
jgi:murein DD-endopeptidase MepM/ murein hydrolase activator NlpD